MKIEISEEVLFQEVSGETVLLDLASEQYFGLDAVGTRVWQLIGAGATAEGVVDTLLTEYEIGRETLAADVAELLDKLAEAGLIRWVEEAWG
jgi:hypothetical protein